MFKKTLLFLTIMLIGLVGQSLLQAQTLSFDEQTPQGYYSPEYVFSTLDLSVVPSGLLLDQAIPLTDLAQFSGLSSNVPTATPTRMQLIYASLYDAACTPADAPDPYALGTPLKRGDHIPFKVLLYEYDRIRTDAVDEGLIQVVNHQLYDISGSLDSPYERQRVIAATPWYEGRLGGNQDYTFTVELNTNTPNEVEKMSIDFGQGYQEVTNGQQLTINTGFGGSMSIQTKIELFSGEVLYANSLMEVKPVISGLTPDGYDGTIEVIRLYEDQTPNPVDGEFDQMTIETACDDGLIRRPLLIISGFETPLLNEVIENDWDKVLELLSVPTVTNGTIYSDFEASGYDIIFLEFYDETNSLYDNAEVVKDAIRYINANKITDEELVIAGVSMGGPLGKMALREMELAGEDHEARLYITVDSPLRGGNIPLGYQSAIYELGEVRLADGVALREIVSFLGLARATLERPSPSEMLIYHYGRLLYGSNSYEDFYEYFTNLGALEKCEFLALSDGSQVGLGQNFNAGDLMLHIQGTSGQAIEDELNLPDFSSVLIDLLSNILIGTGAYGNIKVWAVPNQNEARIFRSFIAAQVIFVPIIFDYSQVSVSGTIPVDSAPGGTSSISDISNRPLVQEFQSHFCFIPTVSGLEVGPFVGAGQPLSDPFEDVSDTDAVLALPQTTMQSLVAAVAPNVWVEEIGGANVFFDNIEHPVITRDLSGVILSKILNGTGLEGELTNRTFNFGNAATPYNYASPPPVWIPYRTEPIIDADLRIGNGGKLWVNGSDRIAFTDATGNPFNATGMHYDVKITGSFCSGEPTTVSVDDKGLIEVGDWNTGMNTGSLGIYNKCSLLVNDGGTVQLNHNSDLYIKEDATMVVAGGAEVLATFGSRITIEENGVLRIGGGGLLRLSQESSLDIKPGGMLMLEDGAIIQLWDGQEPDGRAVIRVEGSLQIDDEFNFSGNGYFHFFPTHELILLGGQFSLEGIAQDSRFLELEYGTTLNFGAVDLELRNGRILYGGQTMIEQSPGASLRLANTRHDGVESATGINAQGLTNLLVTSAQFNNLGTGLELFDLASPSTPVNSLLSNCTFRNCNTGLFVSEGEQLFVQNSVFQEGTYAMLFNRVLSIRSSNNEVSEYLNPQPNGPIEWGAIVLSDVPEFVSSGDDIHHNDIGIFAPATNYIDGDLNQTNIILRAQSTVRNHAQYGVYLAQGGTDENGLDYGLVLMDCANLLDNAVGIAGTDVLLQIDAIENSGSSNPQYWRSNSFRRPIGGSLFNVCYEDRSDITEVSAQGNYWFDPNIASTIHSQHLLQNANIGQGCVGYYPNMPVDVSNFVAQAPTGCPAAPPTNGGDYPVYKDCDIMGDNGSILVMSSSNTFPGQSMGASDNYRTAYSAFEQALATDASTAEVRLNFQNLAGVSATERAQASTICRRYVDVSRVLSVRDYDSDKPAGEKLMAQPTVLPDLTRGLDKEVSALAIAPNPTTGLLQVQTPEPGGTLEVFNTLGQVVLRLTVVDQQSKLDLAGEHDGVYLLKWTAENGQEQQVAKVVLQR